MSPNFLCRFEASGEIKASVEDCKRAKTTSASKTMHIIALLTHKITRNESGRERGWGLDAKKREYYEGERAGIRLPYIYDYT